MKYFDTVLTVVSKWDFELSCNEREHGVFAFSMRALLRKSYNRDPMVLVVTHSWLLTASVAVGEPPLGQDRPITGVVIFVCRFLSSGGAK